MSHHATPAPLSASTIDISPPDTLAGSGASSFDEDEKKKAGDNTRSYETTVEADEVSIEALHVFDDEKLRD